MVVCEWRERGLASAARCHFARAIALFATVFPLNMMGLVNIVVSLVKVSQYLRR
jgi:hypothetical protein